MAQPSVGHRLGTFKSSGLVVQRRGTDHRSGESSLLGPIKISKRPFLGFRGSRVQLQGVRPAALQQGNLSAGGKPLALRMVFEPRHVEKPWYALEVRQQDDPFLEADHRRACRQVAIPGPSLGQLGGQTPPNTRQRPAIHAGDFETPTVLKVIERGTSRRDIIVCPRHRLGTAHRNESVKHLHGSEGARVGAKLRRIDFVRPSSSHPIIHGLPLRHHHRRGPIPLDVNVRGRAMMPIKAHGGGFAVRVCQALGQPGVSHFQIAKRQLPFDRHAVPPRTRP